MTFARSCYIAVAGAMLVALSLAACAQPVSVALPTPSSTPSAAPTPAPSRPALAELHLSPAGLGDLVVGAPVPETPAEIAIVEYDPTGCLVDGSTLSEGDPGAGLWASTYPGDRPFDVVTDGRVKTAPITSILVASPAVSTDAGIAVGSTLDEVLAAYPAISAIPDSGVTLVYVLDAPEGMLAIEIAVDGVEPGYWQPEQVGTVVIMGAYAPGQPVTAVYATDINGSCPV